MFGYLLQIRNYLAILGFNPGVKSTYFHCTMPYFSLIVIIIFSKFLYSKKISHFNPVHRGIHIALKMTGSDCLDNCCHLFIFFYVEMSTQGKGDGGFELVAFTSWDVVHSRLNYPLGTKFLSSWMQCDGYK